jgi:hypothetical protein
MMNQLLKPLLIVLTFGLLQACSTQTEVLISEDDVSNTENSTFTRDGRFFMIGNSTGEVKTSYIYEILKNNQGEYDAVPLVEGRMEFETVTGSISTACAYSGLTSQGNTLYASCVSATSERPENLSDNAAIASLQRINLEAPVTSDAYLLKADLPSNSKQFLPNGMSFDRYGALYISNSFSLLTSDAAIYKVNIEITDQMVINSQPWLDSISLLLTDDGFEIKGEGGVFANGIQIASSLADTAVDTLYFARGLTLVKMDIIGTTHGAVSRVYKTDGIAVIDDFTIIGDKIALAEADVLSFLNIKKSEVKLISIAAEDEGEVLGSTTVDFIPSSVSYAEQSIFNDNAFLVTSFYGGGLREITVSNYLLGILGL